MAFHEFLLLGQMRFVRLRLSCLSVGYVAVVGCRGYVGVGVGVGWMWVRAGVRVLYAHWQGGGGKEARGWREEGAYLFS